MRPSMYGQIIQKHPDSYTAQIVTLDAHCSNLQSRLLATLDALHDLQQNHELERDTLNRRVHVLQKQLAALDSRTKLAEAECDTLRKGVNDLIAKAPYSPLVSPPDPGSKETGLAALVSSLTSQLNTAKTAINDLQKASTVKISSLEAQVALRDVELEAYRPCSCSCHHDPHKSLPSTSTRHRESIPSLHATAPFSQDTALHILEETANRQRELKADVDMLTLKLAAAKSAPHRHAHTATNVVPDSTNNAISNHTGASQSDKSRPVITAVNKQLARLEQDRVALSAERDNITNFVTQQQEIGPPVQHNRSDFKGVLVLEEECIQLRKRERILRQQLLLASTVEEDLRSQIRRLEGPNNAAHTTPNQPNREVDLAQNIPKSTPENQNVSRDHGSIPVRSPSRFAHIESELQLARADAENKEREIRLLVNQIASLRALLQAEPEPS